MKGRKRICFSLREGGAAGRNTQQRLHEVLAGAMLSACGLDFVIVGLQI